MKPIIIRLILDSFSFSGAPKSISGVKDDYFILLRERGTKILKQLQFFPHFGFAIRELPSDLS